MNVTGYENPIEGLEMPCCVCDAFSTSLWVDVRDEYRNGERWLLLVLDWDDQEAPEGKAKICQTRKWK
jgi:hypothetical protein